MSSENIWATIAQELVARDLGVIPDTTGDPEPWLSYAAISHLTRQKVQTIEKKAAGLRRHCLAPFIKLSDLERKIASETTTATEPKTRRKRLRTVR